MQVIPTEIKTPETVISCAFYIENILKSLINPLFLTKLPLIFTLGKNPAVFSVTMSFVVTRLVLSAPK